MKCRHVLQEEGRDVGEPARGGAARVLRDVESGYRELFEHLTSGVGVYEAVAQGSRFVLRDINGAGLKIGKVSRAEVVGRDVEDAFPGARACGLLGALERAWATGQSQRVPASLYRDHRGSYWAETHVYKLPSGEVVALWNDVSSRKEDEENRRLLDGHLRRSQKMEAVGLLASGIAHDFNNILAIIAYNAEIALHDELPGDSPARHGVGQILQAASRGRDLIQQVLSFSRPEEAGRRVVRFGYLTKDALRLLRATIPQTIELRQTVTASRDEILASPSQLLQVVMNLCTNAAHAMREMGGTLSLALSDVELGEPEARVLRLEPGGYVRLSVADTGQGMAPEVLERIFEPYFTTKPRGEGEGMGLAVTHGIVTSHGGAITVESEPGRGTTFEVVLPRCSGASAVAADGEVGHSDPLGTGRVLLVDDEEPITRASGRLLANAGWAVVTASNGPEALQILRMDPEGFDLLITDYAMPGMTGLQLASEVRGRLPGLPIVLCTGYLEAATPEEASALGIREILAKPVRRGELIGALNRALQEGLEGKGG